ncbi:hypothetical protein OkiPb01528_48570 [Escherichia coli]
MTILNKDWPVEFPFPTVIRTVVCSDLDETYIPSDSDKKKLSGIVQLESYITSHAEKKGILAGWITGTNLDSAWRKSRGYISIRTSVVESTMMMKLIYLYEIE